MLKIKRGEVEQQMQLEQQKLARLEVRIRQMSESPKHGAYDVILRDTESELVATYREIAADDDRIQQMFDNVEMYVAQYDGARADKPPFTLYYDDEYRDKDIDAEVAIPLVYAIPEDELIRVR